jgi:hypothetical protein
MDRRRVLEKLLLDGVAVEAGDRAKPPGNRRVSPAALFEVAAEALDVRAPRLEEADAMLLAPGGELAQVERVRLFGESLVASKIATERDPLGIADTGCETTMAADSIVAVMSHLQVELRPGACQRRPAMRRRSP